MKLLTTLIVGITILTAEAQITNQLNYRFTSMPLWDISGDWSFEEDGETADWHMVHSAKGSVYGTHVDLLSSPSIYLRLNSAIKGKVSGTPIGTSFNGTIKGSGGGTANGRALSVRNSVVMKFTVLPSELEMVGEMRIKMTVVGAGTTKVTKGKTMDLPEGMDGTWDLAVNIVNVGNRLQGDGTIELSTGRRFSYLVSGSTNSKTGIRTLRLKGFGETQGSVFVITLQGENISKVTGNLLGQKLRF
jgi:hypothetical protein